MTARGIRLNNPGNIRKGVLWQGMAEIQNDKDFITFATPEYGIRAMAKVFMTYANRYHINTLGETVKRYAPPNENDTDAYTLDVCTRVGVTSDEQIDLTDNRTLTKVIPAFIHHEEGSDPYTPEQIQTGVNLATNTTEEE